MFKVIPIPAFQDNYIWLMVNEHHQQALIVDPGDAEPVIEYLDKHPYQACAILITHHHRDHTGGVDALVARYQLPVYGPAQENIPHCQTALSEDDEVTIEPMGAKFRVIDIPGHTRGHIAYYGHGLVFCGDTLFLGGCGRLFEGTAQQMYDSLSKLSQLPEDTLVYCAHEYTLNNLRFAQAVEPTNQDIQHRLVSCQQQRDQQQPTIPAPLSLEHRTNPFLRTHQEAVKQAAEKRTGQTPQNPVQILSTIREWKDNF